MADRDNLDQDIGQCILSVYDADGYLGIGVDVPGYETAGTSTFEARFPYGTFGRPRDPDVSTDQTSRLGATTLFGFAGRDRHAWPLDDPRVWPKLPQLPKGSAGMYADTARDELPVMVLDGATGSFAVRVPHSTGGGVASRILVDVETPGAEEIVLAHGSGLALRVQQYEVIIGNPLVVKPVAKAEPVVGLISALTAFALSTSTAATAVQIAGYALTLLQALQALPNVPTTNLRTE